MIAGHFQYHELRVPEVDAGAAFYAELFGWTVTETPFGRAFRIGDTVVAGASQVKPGIPAHWTGYVGVDDVAATAAASPGGRGTGHDARRRAGAGAGLGWIAPILDPHNKIVFVAADPQPYPTAPEVGEIIWDRLYTADPEAAADYYTGVLPWSLVRHDDGSPGGLRTTEDVSVADLVTTDDRPPHWLPYVRVADLAAARDRAVELGATVLVDREAFPGDTGHGAVIIDPQGVATGLCQPTPNGTASIRR